jgi:hypothetical protein
LYADAIASLVVLVIDTEVLDAPVVVENLEGGDEGLPTCTEHCPRAQWSKCVVLE